MPIDELYELEDERNKLTLKGLAFSSTTCAVLQVNYADENDPRASARGNLGRDRYGSPTATVYSVSSRTIARGVRILQHGSAVRNMSIWTPTASTYKELSNGRIVVPKRDDYGEAIEPIEWIEPSSVEDFDGDTVIVQNLPTGNYDQYTSVIIGSIPKARPAFERMHLDPFSRNTSDVSDVAGESFEPSEFSADLALSARSNDPSGEPFRHPACAVTTATNLPPKAEGQSTSDYISKSYEAGTLDRTQANPVGEERYTAHNGTIVRIDQQGNIVVDTSLAGLKNNDIDPVLPAVNGDAGHMDINLLRRGGQGLNVRLGGETVFRIESSPTGGSVITLGHQLAEAFSSVLGERLQEVFDNHQHMTPSGATTKPLPNEVLPFAGEFVNIPVEGVKSTNINTANKSSKPVFAHDIILKSK